MTTAVPPGHVDQRRVPRYTRSETGISRVADKSPPSAAALHILGFDASPGSLTPWPQRSWGMGRPFRERDGANAKKAQGFIPQ